MTRTPAKDAASLIIYRGSGTDLEILMGRRRRANFFPGVYVFPGGIIEPADSRVRPPRNFNADRVPRGAIPRIHGLAHAAIRETWEETGLLLAEQGALASTPHPTWEQCRQLGMVPAPQHLSYLGRAITPTGSSRRFHARFFVASLENFSGELLEQGELVDLRWLKPGQPIDLPILDVTEFMLEELQRFLQGPRQATPLLCYRREQTLIRYE